MAKLNLNFLDNSGRRDPTRSEIYQIQRLALSVTDIIKTLESYADENCDPSAACGVCLSVCNALELLMDPIVDYMSNYAGNTPAPESDDKQ